MLISRRHNTPFKYSKTVIDPISNKTAIARAREIFDDSQAESAKRKVTNNKESAQPQSLLHP